MISKVELICLKVGLVISKVQIIINFIKLMLSAAIAKLIGSIVKLIEHIVRFYNSIVGFYGNKDKHIIPLSSDILFVLRFMLITKYHLYRRHCTDNYRSCAFCSHLSKSLLHKYCFSCALKINGESFTAPLIPGMTEAEGKPCVFRSCSSFRRLNKWNYAKNINAWGTKNAIINYEYTEALFYGTANGAKPCHICAGSDLSVYNACTAGIHSGGTTDACHAIYATLKAYYSSSGIINAVKEEKS